MPADSAKITAPDDRAERARRMRRMVMRVLAAHGLDVTASLRRMATAKRLADRMLLAEDQQNAIARGERVRPSDVRRVKRDIEQIASRLDRMRSWGQRTQDWRADDDARRSSRASARSVTASARTARSGQRPALSPPAGCPGPFTSSEGE